MGRLSYLIIICPLAQIMKKCLVLVFTDSFDDVTLDEVLRNQDLRCMAVLCEPTCEEVICHIDIKSELPTCLEVMEVREFLRLVR